MQHPAGEERMTGGGRTEVAVQDAADQARAAAITSDSAADPAAWAVTGRTRSAAWMLTHRRTLDRALA